MVEFLEERYIASQVGCAIGDRLGLAVENWNQQQIRHFLGIVFEPIEPFYITDGQGRKVDEYGGEKLPYIAASCGLKKGDVSDDTLLTLAVSRAIAGSGLDLNAVAKEHLAMYEGAPPFFGFTTVEAIKNLRGGIPPTGSGVLRGVGNAPAMKMSGVGLYMHATGEYEQGLAFAKQVGQMTHLDPRCVASGIVQAHAVYAALSDLSRDSFVDSLVEVGNWFEGQLSTDHVDYKEGTLLSRLEWIKYNRNADVRAAHHHLGSESPVYSSYPFALFMFQKHWEEPSKGLLGTVNFGGDCDTTGAIYGTLAGARHGNFFLPDWISTTKRVDELTKAATQIFSRGAI